MRSNGESRNLEEARRERERQRDHQRHLSQLQFNGDGQLTRQTLESLIDTDNLQAGTIKILQNYLDRNWMLSNLKEAEAHDQRYKLDVMQFKVLGMHPPPESSIQGPLRAYLLDDESAGLFALTPEERAEIDALFDTLKAIVTRGRSGFERIQLNTQIAESRTETSRDDRDRQGRRLRGLFGG